MGDLSDHFSRREFACKGSGRPGHVEHETLVLPELVARLEVLRKLSGGHPLIVVSGHRCTWWNKRVGGAQRSYHLRGAAVDLRTGLYSVALAEGAAFGGIGMLGAWAVHVDCGPRRRWFY